MARGIDNLARAMLHGDEYGRMISAAGNYQRYKTRGFSMEPFIRNGDELLIHVDAGQRYRIGDILLYRSPFHPEPVAHRLIAIEGGGDCVVLRSDSEPGFAESVSSGAVLGRAVAILRQGKIISISSDRWSKRWLNRFIVKVYPAVLDAKHRAVVRLKPVISFLQSYAKTNGFRGLMLTWEGGDPVSADFYRRVGFEDCGTRDGKPLMRKTV